MGREENEFFREVTLRLCGHLEIEMGLQACLTYLDQHLPADALYLQRYEHGLGSMRIIARATRAAAEQLDLLVALPKDAREVMTGLVHEFDTGQLPAVFVVNDPHNEPVTRGILNALGVPPSSAMSLPLIVEGHSAGALVLLAEGSNRFDDHAVRLFSLLREPFYVALSNTLQHTELLELKERLAEDNRELHRDLRKLVGTEIVGANFGLAGTMDLVQKVAPLDSPVLLLGETGVGKDIIANAIHTTSPRSAGPFVKVNCGAIPPSLLDSELFGHEKGAFTGAQTRKRGRFERAHRGTLFLDEIGELPPEAQIRLLRVLQDHSIERVGGTDPVPVDVRIIAATHRHLPAMIEQGAFREDLWFRLAVFPIEIAPLRERMVDMPALIAHLLERKARDLRLPAVPELAPGAIEMMLAYRWPGNVRELANVIERALILDRVGPLSFESLIPGSRPGSSARPKPTDRPSPPPTTTLDEAIAAHIRQVLEYTEGRVQGPGGAAELLNVNPGTLRSKMRKLGIPFGRSSR